MQRKDRARSSKNANPCGQETDFNINGNINNNIIDHTDNRAKNKKKVRT